MGCELKSKLKMLNHINPGVDRHGYDENTLLVLNITASQVSETQGDSENLQVRPHYRAAVSI